MAWNIAERCSNSLSHYKAVAGIDAEYKPGPAQSRNPSTTDISVYLNELCRQVKLNGLKAMRPSF